MNKYFAALAALLAVSPAFAAEVASKAVGTFTPPSCGEPGAALEKATFELTAPGAKTPMRLVYAGCSEEGRNDYLAGYTERSYKGTDGYTLILVTDHGDGAYNAPNATEFSEALVAKGKDWFARFGYISNAKLVKDASAENSGYKLATAKQVPSTAACEAKLPKPIYRGNDLWLLTNTKAYYEREDCDICAELDSCDLKTGEIKEVILGHLIECSDLDRLAKGEDVFYNYCKDGAR